MLKLCKWILIFSVLSFIIGTAHAATTYTYDAAHRLTRVDYGNGLSVAYTYDKGGNVTVIKQVALTKCAMTVTKSGKGTVTPEGQTTVDCNAAQNITATPSTGAVFTGWTAEPSDKVSFADDGAEATTATLIGNAVITANFASTASLTMAVADETGGTTTPAAGTTTISTGTPYAIVAIPDAGKAFSHWDIKGKGIIENKYKASTNVTLSGTCTVTANFADPVNLTMAVSGNGTTDPAVGTHVVAKSLPVAIEATADTGFAFSQWTGSGTFEDDTAASTTVTLDTDGTVTATFLIGVAGVSSTNNPGTYKTGDIITIEIEFGDTVNVTGTPQLKLNSGASAYAEYTGGTGTDTLTFSYTVADGENSSALDYSSTTSLGLNGGTITDASAQDVTLTLVEPGAIGSISADTTIVIDTTPPNISCGVLAADNSYVDVIFNEAVYSTMNGFGALDTTDFTLNFGATTKKAASAVTITQLTNTNDEALSGGERIIRMVLAITGTPTGSETITITVADGDSVFDAIGNAADSTTSTGALSLGFKVTVGSIFPVAASEVTSIASGEFTRKPGIYATFYDPIKDPAKEKLKKGMSKVLTKVDTNTGPQTEVDASWKTKVKLIDYKALKAGYAAGDTCEDYLTTNPISTLGCALNVKTTENDTKIDEAIGRQVLLSPPTISEITNPYDRTEEMTQAHACSLVDVHGAMFGSKAPKAWLEFIYDKKGVNSVKNLKCKTIKLFYPSDKGKANASAMNSNTGVSKIRIQLPKKFPENWDALSTSHNLVIDNGIGVATISFETMPLTENTEPVVNEDTATVTLPDDLKKGVLIDVLANDYDAEGDPLKVMLDSKMTAIGAAISVKKHLILYKPAKDASAGTDSFTYSITDAIGSPVAGTVTVTIE